MKFTETGTAAFEFESFLKIKRELQQEERYRIVEPLGRNNVLFVKDAEAEYDPTVWIVSPGASGSSLLFDNLIKVCPYPTLKSHSYPVMWNTKNCIKAGVDGGFMWEIEENDKVIYLYSHPLNILVSTCTKINGFPSAWPGGHPYYAQFLECNIEKDFFETYLDEDILNLERHLDSWWKKKDFDLLCVKYEKLYDHQQIIREFIEGPTHLVKGGNMKIPLKLPPRKDRKHDWKKHPNKKQLLQTYASVIEKFEQRPDYELFLRENKR